MSLLKDAKKKMARKYLEELLEKKDPEIYRDLAIAANTIAKTMMMSWLDSKRVNHCNECPSCEQLVNLAGSYYCPVHAHKHAGKPLELVMP